MSRGHVNWEARIALSFAAISTIVALVAAVISYNSWKDGKSRDRAYVIPNEVEFVHYPFPQEFGKHNYYLMEELPNYEPTKKWEPPDFEITVLEVDFNNFGKNPASKFGYSIIAIPYKNYKKLEPVTITNYGPMVNDVSGENNPGDKPFVWRARKETEKYFFVIAWEYEDKILNENYCDIFMYTWAGGFENGHAGVDFVIDDKKNLIIKHLDNLSDEDQKKIHFGFWNCIDEIR